ncbi:MAG TPA: type II toxin-antitoxin system RelE/ParE family toxin [Dehalococcoidia bacterium]|nr:type II toxin-antitoxin system RelE/ParE family toxin [Dehalococcoidia bacterium]
MQRVIDALPANERARVSRAVEALGGNPRPPATKRLTGVPLWRIRVGDIRVIYSIWDREQVVIVTKITRRNEHTYD